MKYNLKNGNILGTVDAYTFDEFAAYGVTAPGAVVEDGVLLTFNFFGKCIVRRGAGAYAINLNIRGNFCTIAITQRKTVSVARGSVVEVWDTEMFHNIYKPAEKAQENVQAVPGGLSGIVATVGVLRQLRAALVNSRRVVDATVERHRVADEATRKQIKVEEALLTKIFYDYVKHEFGAVRGGLVVDGAGVLYRVGGFYMDVDNIVDRWGRPKGWGVVVCGTDQFDDRTGVVVDLPAFWNPVSGAKTENEGGH